MSKFREYMDGEKSLVLAKLHRRVIATSLSLSVMLMLASFSIIYLPDTTTPYVYYVIEDKPEPTPYPAVTYDPQQAPPPEYKPTQYPPTYDTHYNKSYPYIYPNAPYYPQSTPTDYIPTHTYARDTSGYVMYLTFDDGPTRYVTPKILDILAERDIRATFFVVGSKIHANPDVMQRIVDEGHVVGIHSYTHEFLEIYATIEDFIEDVELTRDLIAQFTGYKPVIYRFPGGSITRFNEKIREDAFRFLEDNGYIYFDWNASIDDSIGGNKTPQQLLARGLETTYGDKVIMLAHDTQPTTAKMIAELIDILANTYTFDVLTYAVEPIQMRR